MLLEIWKNSTYPLNRVNQTKASKMAVFANGGGLAGLKIRHFRGLTVLLFRCILVIWLTLYKKVTTKLLLGPNSWCTFQFWHYYPLFNLRHFKSLLTTSNRSTFVMSGVQMCTVPVLIDSVPIFLLIIYCASHPENKNLKYRESLQFADFCGNKNSRIAKPWISRTLAFGYRCLLKLYQILFAILIGKFFCLFLYRK